MFDTVHTTNEHLSVFRCDFCSELIPTTGAFQDLRESSICMYGDSWIVCCYHCKDLKVDYTKIGLHRPELSFSYLDLATYYLVKKEMEKHDCTVEQKAELMRVARFIGHRPLV